MYAAGRRDPGSDHRGRLRRVRDRMGRNLRRLSFHATNQNITRPIETVVDRMAYCGLWFPRGHRHDADENRPDDSRPFNHLRMARPRHLDRARRALAPSSAYDLAPP